MAISTIEHFKYDKKDFHFVTSSENEDSKFDIVFKERWSKLEQDNILRYSVEHLEEKVLEGKYGFFAQLNINRATNRRKPEEITSMFKPFDPNSFNFTKILDKEVLFDIDSGNGDNIISVNVSPILWSHSLLLPQRFKCLPQQATLYSFKKAIELLLLSNSVNMRILFNSLCANASVNHLHWHFCYLNQRMFLETAPLRILVDYLCIIEDFPSKGFCIKFLSFKEKNIDDFVAYAYKIVAYLQLNEIAHNIYITRSKSNPDKLEFDDIRIYIWARRPNYGVKNTKDFIIAACEVFGHLPIRTQEGYDSITEEYVSKCLENVTTNIFTKVKEKLVKFLQETGGSTRE
ncbi:GDP-D-glucose phosphorylase 1 [Phymastichus coffea]|uniref:GDP-D-glucose phosphorylase 1 n=1 Tax=Phymastichus coffea TaxID=108790 RepID=UPI00273C30FE|nr:GDP-D-glucose phosphorylase 1 [Phymastichus coffea]XP_058801335.1 GDP-D-glucose phosphorylase 1 [Phymastichus coffea]